MKTNLKRIGAWALCFMLLLSCVPVSADDGLLTTRDYSAGYSLDNVLSEETNITVTFKISNEDYTKDPGSGETHLTTTTPIEGGDLAYTSWAGRFKVTGTGTVCSYTIPSGTSLAENGYSFPALNVDNIGTGNTKSYSSGKVWETDAKMLCTVNTVFSESVTLNLQLYENASSRNSLDFVCGEEERHSIYSGISFVIGESQPADVIEAATAAANAYAEQYCTHGAKAGETLSKWQIKKTNGEMVDFEAGLPLTSEYDIQDYALRVYAVWEAPPVTATFQVRIDDGDPQTEDQVISLEEDEAREYSAGAPLGTLPDVSKYVSRYEEQGYALLRWEYTDSEGATHIVTPETVITQNTTYTAVIGQQAYYSVILHDILPDGSEGDRKIDLQAQAGTLLRDALADYSLEDGTSAADCVWHDGENGPEVDLSSTVDSLIDTTAGETSVDLYTYTYQLVLTLEQAVMTLSMVEIETQEDGTLTLTITAREGETLSAADFVDPETGVDYSLYTWTYTDEEGNIQQLNLQSLIGTGLSENITATSSGTLSNTTGTKTINFYLCIDDEWTSIATRTMQVYWLTNSWYLSSAQLQSVYGKYGFGGMSAGTKLFPHAEAGNTTIWGDRAAIVEEGLVYSPIINTNGTSCDVYYLPDQTVASSSQRDQVKDGNVFYTVTVADPAGKVYDSDALPEKTYTLNGGNVSTTVEASEGITWQCVSKDGSATVSGTDNGDGTVTFTIENIGQPYVISPVLGDNEVLISYEIDLPQTPTDPEYSTPTIEGGSSYTEIGTRDSDYIVRTPSLLSYFYSSGKYLGLATFQGWMVNGDTNNLVQPGETFDLNSYPGQSVVLTALWETELGGTAHVWNSSMVNFFVALNAVSEGTTSWTGNTQQSAFTQSVYTTDCGITGTTATQEGLYENSFSPGQSTQYHVLGGTSGTNLSGNHSTIVNSLSGGYTLQGNDGQSYTYHASFPSDETVLRNVRNMVANGTSITINNHTIAPEELTTANFTVKWYVFKFDSSDGWHIDGILVAKTGEMIVKKTFAGDSTAIDNVKNSFSINVSGGSAHSGGTLTLSNNASQSGNTYTWTVPVDQYYDYTVTESNYEYSDEMYTCNNLMRVTNSTTEGQNTGGWRQGTSTTVTGRGHNEDDDERLTVAFLNTYTAPGTVILRKEDAATGNLMPNVSFTIAKDNDENFSMSDNGNGSYSANGSGTTTITTDSTGQAYLYIGGGTYRLNELVPTGYDDPGTITMELNGSEGNDYKVVSITSASAVNGSGERTFVTHNGAGLVVTIQNYSRTIDLTVTKNWADGENKPVTIQLYRNGNPLGANYTVTFDGKTDSVESPAWSHTFTNLPLYADGGLAQYSLREEALGDFKYSDAYDDGYQYYDVTYSGMSYLDANGATTGDMTAVKTIAMSVTNKRSTGALSINKVDNTGAALAGATFYLYSAEGVNNVPTIVKAEDGTQTLSGLTSVGTATSNASGTVSFGTKPAGVYYLVEHQAPQYYEASDSVYRLTLSNGITTLEAYANGEWAPVSNRSVVNTRLTRDVEITKQVTGNMGDVNKPFEFSVTSTETIGAPGTSDSYTLSTDSKMASFSLKSGQSVTLRDVPIGAELTIAETNATGYTMTVSPNNGAGSETTYTIPEGTNVVQITVTNDNTATIDTGVTLDFLPYVLLILGVGIAVALWLVMSANKRKDD